MTKEELTTVFGLIATILSTINMVPQVYTTLKTRRLDFMGIY